MSYLYRPTPVFNPGPPRGIPLSGAVSGGVMRGYADGVNWKAYFDSKRAAVQGNPWIVRSGTMGSFLAAGLGDDSIDLSNLPLAPIDTSNIDLSSMLAPLPVDLYPMPAPIEPSIAPFSPGPISAAPPIVSSGRSITSPAPLSPSSQAATPWAQIVNSLTSFGTAITKAATGQPQINPAIPPVAPPTQSSLVAQAQSLQAQAAALATTNPTLAAQYTSRANSLLAKVGVSSGASWFTQSTVIAGFPNWGILAGGAAAVLVVMGIASRGRGK